MLKILLISVVTLPPPKIRLSRFLINDLWLSIHHEFHTGGALKTKTNVMTDLVSVAFDLTGSLSVILRMRPVILLSWLIKKWQCPLQLKTNSNPPQQDGFTYANVCLNILLQWSGFKSCKKNNNVFLVLEDVLKKHLAKGIWKRGKCYVTKSCSKPF